MALVSVIVTVYNKRKYLEQALNSILSQSLNNIEIICVDDGSTDGSDKVLDEYADRYSNVRVYHKPNEGLVSARKVGVEKAMADYVMFIDADDYIDSNMMLEMYNYMKENELDFVSTGLILHNNSIVCDKLEQGIYYLDAEGEYIYTDVFGIYSNTSPKIISNTVTKLYKREILKKTIVGIDNDIHFREDDCLVFSYLMSCDKIGILHKAYYYYRYDEESDSHRVDEFYYLRANKFYLFLKDVFSKSVYKPILLPQLELYYVKTLLYGINNRTGFGAECIVSAELPLVDKERILIYGAGEYGNRIAIKVLNSNKTLVGVIDRDWKEKQNELYDVISIDAIEELLYDVVLIAIVDKHVKDIVRKQLIEVGVPQEKITML